MDPLARLDDLQTACSVAHAVATSADEEPPHEPYPAPSRAYDRYAAEYLGSMDAALSWANMRKRLNAFYDAAIANFCKGTPPRCRPTTRGFMEIAPGEGEGLDEDARQVFASLLTRLIKLVESALREGASRGEFREILSAQPCISSRLPVASSCLSVHLVTNDS